MSSWYVGFCSPCFPFSQEGSGTKIQWNKDGTPGDLFAVCLASAKSLQNLAFARERMSSHTAAMDLAITVMQAPLWLLCCDVDLNKFREIRIFEEFAEFVGKLRPRLAALRQGSCQILNLLPDIKNALEAIIAAASGTLNAVETLVMSPKLALIVEVMYADKGFWQVDSKFPENFLADAGQVESRSYCCYQRDSQAPFFK